MNWTYEDQMIFESDVKDSILAEAGYFHTEPNFMDLKEKDSDEFCYPFF